MSDYWRSVLSGRISRRRAIVTTGAGAAAAAFLAACGGGGSSDSKGPVKDPQGLLAKIEDTTSQKKAGGVWPSALNADLPTLDPNQTTSGSALAPYGYSRLFLYRPAPYPELPKGEVDPDVAESSEQSPDGLTVTVKLRGDVKLDPRAPTNGRLLNAQDVKWSWDKFASNNSSRGEMVNALSPSAPVQSVSVLDTRTVQFKLAHPVANFLSSLAFQRYMWVLPVEADGRFDAKIEMRGSGPWRLTKWEPSVGFTFERNPDWHFKTGAPALQGIYHPIVSEYSQRRAQFLSGNLWSHSIDSVHVVRAEEVVQTKKENPKLAMYPKTFPVTRRPLFTFGFLPNSPFNDVRIRRAASMVLDRDSWIDAFYGVSAYEKDGLTVDARWDSHYMAGEPPYWIDPKGKGLGEGAAHFAFNVAEATKLVRAAGIPGALKQPGYFNAGAGNNQQVQALQGMLNESKLFDISLEGFPTPEWNLKFHLGEGQHEGIAFNQSTGQSGDIDNHISVRYNEGNGQRIFFKKSPSQKMQDLVIAQRKELDDKKRLTILEDLQKEMAMVMPAVPWPGAATGFDLAWPHLENFAAFTARSNQTPMVETWSRFWYNESKKG